jgi:septum formation protein
MRQIILASKSPQRKELLAGMGVKFDVIPSDYDEQLDDSRSPAEVAKELGLGKALAVAKRYPDAIVIGSDALVSVGNRQLGKAKDMTDARAMLQFAAQEPNKITTPTAVVCLDEDIQLVAVEVAWVYFKPFHAAAVEAYLQTGDYRDKAGAYGVQSGAAGLIEYVEGNFGTIVGLPTHMLATFLQGLGVAAKPVELVPPDGLIVKKFKA